MRVFFFVLCLFLPLALQAQSIDPDQRHILVTGTGSVSAEPDMATVSLGISERADNPRDAMSATSDVMSTILERLARFGLDPRDVQTSRLSLNPVYDREANDSGPSEIRLFQASNQLSVNVRNLSDLGAILEAVLEDGANQLNGLQFGLQDPEPHLDRARRAAVEDARARAKTYADAAGVRLGDVLRIVESGDIARPEMAMMRAADSGMPIAAGEADIIASVTIWYAIAD